MYVFVNIRDDDGIVEELGLFKVELDSEGGDVFTAFPSALKGFGQFGNRFLVKEHPVCLEMGEIL